MAGLLSYLCDTWRNLATGESEQFLRVWKLADHYACPGFVVREHIRISCSCACHTPESQQCPSRYWRDHDEVHIEAPAPRKKPTRRKHKSEEAPPPGLVAMQRFR